MSQSGKPDERAHVVANSNNPTNSSSVESTGGAASFLGRLKARTEERAHEAMSLEAWMELCKTEPAAYQSFEDRLLKAIGKPKIVDTSRADLQTRLIHGGKKIPVYEAFNELFDSEDVAAQLVTFLENGAKGLLVLRGPVGSGKTEIATILEKLAETQPLYMLKCKTTGKLSPFNDSPLCLFSESDIADDASDQLGIPRRYLNHTPSAWVTKRLDHHKGDASAAFEVVKVFPSRDRQLGVAKLDPKDPKTADMDSLVGSVDMTLIGEEDPLDPKKTLSAGDPDAYKPGVFSRSHGGVFHAAEFFRNNPALLNTFLEGVTTGYFTGNGGIGTLPMSQLIVITSNDPVWKNFKKANDSDAARNRIEVIDVPYTLRMSEELKIYEKLLKKGRHSDKPMAPGTKELLAEFSVVSRLMDGVGGALKPYDVHVRARVLNGEIPDGAEKKVPKLHELRAKADPSEGLSGFTIRDADRVLSRTFRARATEGIEESDTILLLETLRDFINNANEEDYSPDDKKRYLGYIQTLAERNRKELDEKINAAIIDADDATCQRIFDEYLEYADAWQHDKDLYTDMGEPINPDRIEKHLKAFETRANITSGPDFRKSAVASINSEIARIARSNEGKPLEEQKSVRVRWDSYPPVEKAIRAQYEIDKESRLQILRAKSDSDLRSEEEKRQYSRFHKNMNQEGYTDSMLSRILHHLSYT